MSTSRPTASSAHSSPSATSPRCTHRPLAPRPHLIALGAGLPRSHIAPRKKYAIARSPCFIPKGSVTGKWMGGGEVEGERWSVVWALDDPDERSPPSSFVAQCDTAEVLTLALAAAVAKRRRNARLAAAALVSISLRSWTRCKQDGKEKGKIVARSKPAGELWRRLIRVYSSGPAAVAAANTVGLQPHVVFALKAWTRLDPRALITISRRC